VAAATATGGPSVAPPDISALDAAVVEAAAAVEAAAVVEAEAAVEAVAERVAAVGVGDFDSFAGEAVDARVFPCGALTVCWFDGDFLTARS
jgi:hypothetical protein